MIIKQAGAKPPPALKLKNTASLFLSRLFGQKPFFEIRKLKNLFFNSKFDKFKQWGPNAAC